MTLPPRKCPDCGTEFQPTRANHVYCPSIRCRWTRGERRRKAREAGDQQAVLKRRAYQTKLRRAKGIKDGTVRISKTCPQCGERFDGIFSQVYCSVKCRRRKNHDRDLERANPDRCEVILMASRHGKARRVRCTVTELGGLLVWCPCCGDTCHCQAGVIWQRRCAGCGVEFNLNPEEIQWVIYETLSTARPMPTAS